nr:MAG TPA: hypothetical protein [Caudoviricetes sp.]
MADTPATMGIIVMAILYGLCVYSFQVLLMDKQFRK